MLAFFKLYLELANLVYSYLDIFFFALALYPVLSTCEIVTLAVAAVYNSIYQRLDFKLLSSL